MLDKKLKKKRDEVNSKFAIRIKELEQEVAEKLAGWKRAAADYQNLKKESERKQSELMKASKSMFLSEILPIYDLLKRALAHKPKDEDLVGWSKGIEQIKAEWQSLLKQWGVEEIETNGKIFDPEKHEALGTDPTRPENTIVEEAQGGYRYDGKTIIPARVIVGAKDGSRSKK